MKRIVLILILLATLSLALANVMPSYALKKVWVDANGDLQVKFFAGTLFGNVGIDLFDGSEHFVDTIDFDNPANFTQVYPDAAVSSASGNITVTNNVWTYGVGDEVHWGAGLENDLSPLASGECAMQVHHPFYSDTSVLWVKELDMYMDSSHWPETRSNLEVSIVDCYGSPVANCPVFTWSEQMPAGVTDVNGHYYIEVVSSKLRVLVKHPQTQEAVLDTTFFAEPLQTYTFNVQFPETAVSDLEYLGTFKVYPSVLRNAEDLHLSFDGKLGSEAKVELYDLKGRIIARHNYSGTDFAWQLPALSNGVYFVKLLNGKQDLGSRKLIILK